MRHLNALCLKLAAYVLIFGLTMPVLGRLALSKSLLLAAALTLLLWLADLSLLPRFGRISTLGTDLGILLVGSLMLLRTMGAIPRPLGLLLGLVLAALFELWFHHYLSEARLLDD